MDGDESRDPFRDEVRAPLFDDAAARDRPSWDTTAPASMPTQAAKPIKGWPGYWAGDDGKIYSSKSGTFEPIATWQAGRERCRYDRVTLYNGKKKRNFSVHTLIALTFCGRRPRPTSQVRHKDGDRTNNRPDNVQWGTKLANERDKIAHGTAPLGEKNGRSKLSAGEAKLIRDSAASATLVLAAAFGISERHVRDIRAGRSWRHL